MQSKRVKLISPTEALTKGSPTDFYPQKKNVKIHTTNDDSFIELQSIQDSLNNDINSNNKQESTLVEVKKVKRQGMRLNNYNLMVKFEDGNQISEVPKIYPLPNSPEWFLGMSNLNGQTIPVFNLTNYFNLDEGHDDKEANNIGKKPMLFVIQQGENATGIIIDRLLERLDISEDNVQHNISVPNKLQECVNNTYLLNKEVWYDLNCLSFLDSLEQQIVS